MKRGGKRPGAGRPPGSPNHAKTASSAAPEQPAALPLPLRKAPIEYLLDVVNDPTADPERRDRAAEIALRFGHLAPGEKKTANTAGHSFKAIIGGKK